MADSADSDDSFSAIDRNGKRASFCSDLVWEHSTLGLKLVMFEIKGTSSEVMPTERVTLNAVCNQDLRRYPLDYQKCGVKIASFAHPTTKVVVKWVDRKPLAGNPGVKLAELEVVGYSNEICDSDYTYAETDEYRIRGNFSCLYAAIHLKRQLGYHMVQTYVPTALIVVISWVSFFIDPTAVPARVSLSFTTLLTLSTMAAGLRVSLPPVAYAKAIDIWVGTCMFFVFASLLQFALVNSYMRSATALAMLTGNRNLTPVHEIKVTPSDEVKADCTAASMENRIAEEANRKLHNAIMIDKICRVVFPGMFVVFNITYWMLYGSH